MAESLHALSDDRSLVFVSISSCFLFNSLSVLSISILYLLTLKPMTLSLSDN